MARRGDGMGGIPTGGPPLIRVKTSPWCVQPMLHLEVILCTLLNVTSNFCSPNPGPCFSLRCGKAAVLSGHRPNRRREVRMPAAQGAERRRAPRRKVANSLTFVVDSDRDQIANRAFAVDLSELGARIRAGLRLKPGQRITVVPSEGTAAGIPSQVIWVTLGATTGEAGIAFLEPLAAHPQP